MAPLWFWICGWFLTIAAVVGNGFVVGLVLSRRRLHTTANWFILSLALADFLFAMAFLPQAFACPEQDAACEAVKYLSSILNLASITNTCLMTLDRYVAISRPLTYFTFMKSRTVVCLIAAAWFLPTCIYLSPRLIWCHTSPGSTTHQNAETMLRHIFLVVPVLSCTFVTVATVHVFVIVRMHSRQLTALRSQLQYNHTRRTSPNAFPRRFNRGMSSVRVLMIVIAVFVACYLIDIYVVIVDTFLKVPRSKLVDLAIRLLFITNSAVNPIVYAFFKRDIKKEARNSFCLYKNRTRVFV